MISDEMMDELLRYPHESGKCLLFCSMFITLSLKHAMLRSPHWSLTILSRANLQLRRILRAKKGPTANSARRTTWQRATASLKVKLLLTVRGSNQRSMTILLKNQSQMLVSMKHKTMHSPACSNERWVWYLKPILRTPLKLITLLKKPPNSLLIFHKRNQRKTKGTKAIKRREIKLDIRLLKTSTRPSIHLMMSRIFDIEF